jgi:hypothetical protein
MASIDAWSERADAHHRMRSLLTLSRRVSLDAWYQEARCHPDVIVSCMDRMQTSSAHGIRDDRVHAIAAHLLPVMDLESSAWHEVVRASIKPSMMAMSLHIDHHDLHRVHHPMTWGRIFAVTSPMSIRRWVDTDDGVTPALKGSLIDIVRHTRRIDTALKKPHPKALYRVIKPCGKVIDALVHRGMPMSTVRDDVVWNRAMMCCHITGSTPYDAKHPKSWCFRDDVWSGLDAWWPGLLHATARSTPNTYDLRILSETMYLASMHIDAPPGSDALIDAMITCIDQDRGPVTHGPASNTIFHLASCAWTSLAQRQRVWCIRQRHQAPDGDMADLPLIKAPGSYLHAWSTWQDVVSSPVGIHHAMRSGVSEACLTAEALRCPSDRIPEYLAHIQAIAPLYRTDDALRPDDHVPGVTPRDAGNA